MLWGTGNNLSRNIDPGPSSPLLITRPTPLTHHTLESTVLFHCWTSTVVRGDDGTVHAWGDDEVVPLLKAAPSGIDRVVAVDDRPTALLADRRVWVPASPAKNSDSIDSVHVGSGEALWTPSLVFWDDAGVLDTGTALGYRTGHGVERFESLSDMCAGVRGVIVSHPLIHGNVKVYTTESRALLVTHCGESGAAAAHVLELVFDYRDVSRGGRASAAPLSIRVVDDLEGLGVRQVAAGLGNRFAVVTSAGEGYILGPRGEVDSVILDDEDGCDTEDAGIDKLVLGQEFELVLSSGRAFVRGANDFGQLGVDGQPDGWVRMDLGSGRAVDAWAGRWSTLIRVEEE